MLTIATRQGIVDNIPLCYELSQNKKCSCFPSYTDQIKTYDDFANIALHASNTVLLYKQGHTTKGWIVYSCEDDAINVHSLLCLPDVADIVHLLLAHLSAHTTGKQINIGMNMANENVCQQLELTGFELQEKLYATSIVLYNKVECDCPFLTKIDANNFDLFADVHKLYQDDMYWTNQRILDDITNWSIYILHDEGVVCHVLYAKHYAQLTEIFGIEGMSVPLLAKVDMIKELMADMQKCGRTNLTYFAEGLEGLSIATDAGLDCIGVYKAYSRMLI